LDIEVEITILELKA